VPASRALTVDGGSPLTLRFAQTAVVGGDWTNWAGAEVVAVKVTLPPGTSTLTMTRLTDGDGPLDVDAIDLTV